jgi:hypothetical protein
MKKSLLIITGTGDANHPNYKMVYDIIKDNALKRSFDDVIIPTLFGQESHSSVEPLRLDKNSKLILAEIERLESTGKHYDVICRSYGCSVFFEMERRYKPVLEFLNRVIMWGPSPFYVYYKFGFKQIESYSEKGKLKGTILDEDLFKTMYPFELHVKEFENNFDLTIATGTLDHYCSEAFLNYLANDNKDKEITFLTLEELPHAVKVEDSAYLELLLGSK